MSTQKFDPSVPMPIFNSASEIFAYFRPLFKNFNLEEPWYLPETIPPKELKGASKHLLNDLQEDELLILYYDATITGAGDDGTIITNKRIKTKSFLGDPVSIYYTDPFVVGFYKKVTVTVEKTDLDKKKDEGLKKLGKLASKIPRIGKSIETATESLRNKDDNFKQQTIKEFDPTYIPDNPENECLVVKTNGHLIEIDCGKNSIAVYSFLNGIREKGLIDKLTHLGQSHIADVYADHRTKTLKDYPENLKAIYLRLLVPIMKADGDIDPTEQSALYQQFVDLNCSQETRMAVLEELQIPENRIDELIEQLRTILKSYAENDRKLISQSLYKNVIEVAKSDFTTLDPVELEMIAAYKSRLGLSDAQTSWIEEKVDNDARYLRGEISDKDYVKNLKRLTSASVGIGIPLTILGFAGAKFAGAAAITHGLLVIGGSMWSGIGILILGGVGTYKLLEYVLFTGERERKKIREKMLQRLIENHQKAIAVLTEDFNYLSARLEEAMRNTQANALMIEKLSRQMALFKETLKVGRREGEQLESFRQRKIQ